jgi:hypothetical protein
MVNRQPRVGQTDDSPPRFSTALVAACGRRLDTTASRFDRSVATAEHLFEGAQRSQQIGLM